MDRFKGKRFAWYSLEEVERCISNNQLELGEKRWHELIASCVISRCVLKLDGNAPDIGFMVKGSFSSEREVLQPTLISICQGNLIDDCDFDIALQYPDDWGYVQITRLEKNRADGDPYKGLLSLIKKKSLTQRDPFLDLVLLMDHTFDLRQTTLINDLKTGSIPYARIHLIGPVSAGPRQDEFRLIQVFPEYATNEVKMGFYLTS